MCNNRMLHITTHRRIDVAELIRVFDTADQLEVLSRQISVQWNTITCLVRLLCGRSQVIHVNVIASQSDRHSDRHLAQHQKQRE